MKKFSSIRSIACFLWCHSIIANPVITFFVRPYPEPNATYAQHMTDKLKKPGTIAKQHSKRLTAQATAGIFAIYAGYMQVSDAIGQITFPRKHTQPLLYLAITNKLIPIVMFANTVHHWEFEPSSPVAYYTVERTQDPTTNAFLWRVTEIPRPDDNVIPREALILLVKPSYIFVPTGITLTRDTPNLQLPDMYAKKGINTSLSALYILNLAHFFSPVSLLYKKENTRLSSQPGT